MDTAEQDSRFVITHCLCGRNHPCEAHGRWVPKRRKRAEAVQLPPLDTTQPKERTR